MYLFYVINELSFLVLITEYNKIKYAIQARWQRRSATGKYEAKTNNKHKEIKTFANTYICTYICT